MISFEVTRNGALIAEFSNRYDAIEYAVTLRSIRGVSIVRVVK